MVVNAALAVGLAPLVGWIAPAIATTLAGWTMFFCLALGARRWGDAARFDSRFHRRIWRILAASAAMGAILWGANVLLQPILGMDWWRVLALLALVVLAMLSYFGVGHLIGAFRLGEFRRALRR
jgi:putative peptidoglycan lipid II flippase